MRYLLTPYFLSPSLVSLSIPSPVLDEGPPASGKPRRYRSKNTHQRQRRKNAEHHRAKAKRRAKRRAA